MIRYNNIADYFILVGFDNREDLDILYIWMFHKDQIIRDNKFWKRDGFAITNNDKGLKKFKNYEIIDELGMLKYIINEMKEVV